MGATLSTCSRAILRFAAPFCVGVVLLALGFVVAPNYKVTSFAGLLVVMGFGVLAVFGWLVVNAVMEGVGEALFGSMSDRTKRIVVYSLLALGLVGAVLVTLFVEP